jgi:hypothetical protein
MGTADEIAAAVAFLAWDESAYMTGAELLVYGGYAQVCILKALTSALEESYGVEDFVDHRRNRCHRIEGYRISAEKGP